MELYFDDRAYDRLEVDPHFTHGLTASVVTQYRRSLQLLRAARDEADLFAMHSLRYQLLVGNSNRRHTIYLNDEYVLLMELQARGGDTAIQVVEIRNVDSRPQQRRATR